MKIQTSPIINFKSDYYGFEKRGSVYIANSIKTDDLPQKGKDLILHYSAYNNRNELVEEDLPMTYDGKYYTCTIPDTRYEVKYKILNKEREAEGKALDPWIIRKDLNIYDRLSTGKPLEHIILKGSAEGVVVTDIDNIPKDKPVIVLLDEFNNDMETFRKIARARTNVKGVVVGNSEVLILSHVVNLMKQYFNMTSIVWDDKKYEQLKNLKGEKVFVSNENGLLEFSKINEFSPQEEIKPKTPIIPILEPEEQLLDFSELTRKNSGEKAYRLGVMQKLLNEGYLSGIEVPPGFVMPLGYLNKITEYLNNNPEFEEDNSFTEDIINKCREHGIDKECIFRSAFNAEDLPDYPTAGIYKSSISYTRNLPKDALDDISFILDSKNAPPAKKSRERYGVSDDVVQPTIIVQKYISTDYPFTIYTDYDNGNLLIEMLYYRLGYFQYKNPARIIYDRKSGEIKLDPPRVFANYLVKDTGEVVEQTLKDDYIVKDWQSILAPIKTTIENALKLEQYFGRPQDIEGGIRNGKVYFWQTRDIIKKSIKH